MKCDYCNQQMVHANMSDTYHCLNNECTKPKENPQLSLEAIKIKALELRVAKLEHLVSRLAADHGRC